MATPYIRHVYSEEEMIALLKENSVAVVSFHAAWSAPCREIAPLYSQLAAKHRTLTFVEVQVNANNIQSVGQRYRLVELPTFIVIKNEEETDRICGADQKGLEDMIVKYAPKPEPTGEGSESADVSDASDSSLLEYLDLSQVNCLNEAPDHTLRSVVEKKRRNTTEAYLESDADKQLLITLRFNQAVKVRSIVLYTKDSRFGPKDVKIDINKPTLGLNDMESATEPAIVRVLAVSEGLVKEGNPIHLPFVRLQQVNILQIFVGTNHGDEAVTRIDAIDVYGPNADQPATAMEPSGLRNFSQTYQRGVDLLCRFHREGGSQNLSESALLLREALLICPKGFPQRAMIFGNLAVALLTQHEQRGNDLDLMEAIHINYGLLALCPPGHPYRVTSLTNLSTALMARYSRDGNVAYLSDAIQHRVEALQLCPVGHPDRAKSLGNLSNALMARYNREGSQADLSEATQYRLEALELCPVGHPDRAGSLTNLSNALMARYDREGNPADLSVATQHRLEALKLRPVGHPDRAKSLGNLSNALIAQYNSNGNLADLSKATQLRLEALELCPVGHLDRAGSLTNLSNSLLARYEREGRPEDLSTATKHYREALQLRAVGHPDRARSLNNLSNALMVRYKHEDSLADLSEATQYRSEALELCPVGHPVRAGSLTNLSNSLLARYEREDRPEDLSKAIEHYREALKLRPLAHPDRAGSLGNLSNALMNRYKHEGSLADLSEATQHRSEALKLCPVGHPDRAGSLINLSNSLLARYEREGRPIDLSKATAHYRGALELRPLGHPGRANTLRSLSLALLQTIGRESNTADTEGYRTLVSEVFEVLREAADLLSCPPRDCLSAALLWIHAAGELAPESTLDAYRAALDRLDTVLAASSTLEDKRTQLSSSKELARCKRLGVEAAYYAVRQGHLALAVELLERGRNLLFGQVVRYRVELEELRRVDAEVANRFSRLSGLLDKSVVSNLPILEGRTPFEDPTERYRRVSLDWNQTVDDIRNMEGFSNFLKAPDYATLRTAAAEGPVIIVIPNTEQSDALIISQHHDEPHHVILPEAGEAELVELRGKLIRAVDADDERTTERAVKRVLGSLWDLVVGPIADALENELNLAPHSRIWWCPASLLSFLPLHAAGCYTRKDSTQNLPYRYVSSYTPTLQALTRARHNHSVNREKKPQMLIVAQPDTPGQPQLPNARAEAELVKKLAEATNETALISSEGGTCAVVLDGMARHSWLHLICHGIQNSDNPFQSCFRLYDGPLTLQDIMRSGLLDARFAYLAACRTATGDDKLSDEGLHLAAGLQFAGFKGVVGTTWKVADEDGPLVAKAFYQALQEEGREGRGMDCSRAAYALNRALKQLRADGVVMVNSLMRFIHIGI